MGMAGPVTTNGAARIALVQAIGEAASAGAQAPPHLGEQPRQGTRIRR